MNKHNTEPINPRRPEYEALRKENERLKERVDGLEDELDAWRKSESSLESKIKAQSEVISKAEEMLLNIPAIKSALELISSLRKETGKDDVK